MLKKVIWKKIMTFVLMTLVVGTMLSLSGCFLKSSPPADNEPEEPPVETWEKFYGAELDAWAYNEELEAL